MVHFVQKMKTKWKPDLTLLLGAAVFLSNLPSKVYHLYYFYTQTFFLNVTNSIALERKST